MDPYKGKIRVPRSEPLVEKTPAHQPLNTDGKKLPSLFDEPVVETEEEVDEDGEQDQGND